MCNRPCNHHSSNIFYLLFQNLKSIFSLVILRIQIHQQGSAMRDGRLDNIEQSALMSNNEIELGFGSIIPLSTSISVFSALCGVCSVSRLFFRLCMCVLVVMRVELACWNASLALLFSFVCTHVLLCWQGGREGGRERERACDSDHL